MPKRDATDGELLCTFIKKQVLDERVWGPLAADLAPLGRGDHLSAFFEALAAVHLTGRLVIGGKSIADLAGNQAKAQVETDEFAVSLRNLLRETTELSAKRRREVEPRLLALSRNAVRACYEPVSADAEDEVRAEAGRRPKCFLCARELIFARGAALDRLTDEEKKRVYEVEHVWPRSYGGNSTAENLLPACHDCNRRKANYATWAMVDVQALILGVDPSEDERGRVPGGAPLCLAVAGSLRACGPRRLNAEGGPRSTEVANCSPALCAESFRRGRLLQPGQPQEVSPCRATNTPA